jgi:hypothetical protein
VKSARPRRHGYGQLPIIVGVTGHRDPRPEDSPLLEAAIERILDGLVRDYPATPLLILSPLAEGADRILVRIAEARNLPYIVPMPLPRNEYRRDFSPQGQVEFDRLLAGAQNAYVMPYFGDNDAGNVHDPARRAHQYALVGAHVARAAHVLIALWDGTPSRTVGGTAAIVRYRCYGAPREYQQPGSSLLDAPQVGAVHQVYTPRAEAPDSALAPGSTQRLVADKGSDRARHLLVPLAPDESDPFDPLYRRIEEFNSDCATARVRPSRRDSACERLAHAAERVATYYQNKSKFALVTVFVTTFLAAITFAAYSHGFVQKHWLVIPYAVWLTIAVSVYRYASRRGWQDRSQDYRALEVGLLVQRVWDIAGLGASVADVYLRRQRSELTFIPHAIRTAHDIDRTEQSDTARGIEAVRRFVEEQLEYFKRNAIADGSAFKRYESLAHWALLASFVVSAVLIAFGLYLTVFPDRPYEEAHRLLLFFISAAAVLAALFHDYPQRRAFHQQARRYAVMSEIYQRALTVLDAAPDDLDAAREVIREIGREALSENGEWVLLHRELPLELLPPL